MQTQMTGHSAPSQLWRIVDVLAFAAALAVVAIVLRQSMVLLPWDISSAFAQDNPLPGVAMAFDRFERVASMGLSASLFLLGYGLIRKMACPKVQLGPFVVASVAMAILIISLVSTWRTTPALSWTRPDAAEVSRQLWSAYAWTSSQSGSLPSWARGGLQAWRLPGGLVARVETRDSMTRVSLPVAPGDACEYLLDELSGHPLPQGARLMVDSHHIDEQGYGNACRGANMKQVILVSEKWPERS